MTSRLQIVVTRRARKQIEAAHRWWNENRPSAPDAVIEDLDHALQVLSIQPDLGVPAANSNLTHVRRVTLSRIRYYMYYRVAGQSLEVLAFWHTSRGRTPNL